MQLARFIDIARQNLTAQKNEVSSKDFFDKYEQIRRKI